MKHIMLYFLVLAITAVSCKTEVSDNHEGEDAHDHGAVKINLTEYSDQFELFAEADPFIVGETSSILAHFTNLLDFKPLTEGSVTVSLIVGTNGIRQIVETPVKQGIYQFALQPEVSGTGKLIFDIKNEKGEHKIVINDVVVYEDEHEAIHVAGEEEIEQINVINFTKEQSWKIDFQTYLIAKKQFGEIIKTTAQILPDQSEKFIITSKTNGFVVFQDNILEGEDVKTGKVLLNISGSDLADDNASVRFREAENNYDLAKDNFERNQALAKNKIVSEKELAKAKAEYENTKVVYDNLKKNFNANGQIVTSPKEGIIEKVFVSNGQYVNAGDALLSVLRNNNLIVKAEVQQKYFSVLNSIYSATIKSLVNNKIYELNEMNGKFLSFGKSIDKENSFLIPVNFQIENNGEFLAGSFVEMYIKTKLKEDVLVVPNTALIEEQGNFFVFVQITPELFEKRQVKIGKTDGKNSEVLTGISENERIVTKGGIIVKLAAVSNSLDPHAGHVH